MDIRTVQVERRWGGPGARPLEQGLPALEWAVFADYRISGGFLRSADRTAILYKPAYYPQMVADLASVRPSDEVALVEFARNWGALGHGLLLGGMAGPHVEPDDVWASPDPLLWVYAHAEGIRLVLDLVSHIQQADHDSLGAYLQALVEGDPLSHPDAVLGSRGLKLTFYFGRRHERALGQTLGAETWEESALRVIQEIVNPNLGGLVPSLEVGPTKSSKGLELRLRPCALLEVAYWHLARVVAGHEALARCKECGRYYVRTDGRQRFCPPGPWEPKSAESRCSRRGQMREYRERVRKGIQHLAAAQSGAPASPMARVTKRGRGPAEGGKGQAQSQKDSAEAVTSESTDREDLT